MSHPTEPAGDHRCVNPACDQWFVRDNRPSGLNWTLRVRDRKKFAVCPACSAENEFRWTPAGLIFPSEPV